MEYLAQHIEGLIFTAEQPLSKEDIKFCLEETFETTLDDEDLESALQHLMDRYKADKFSFEILAIGGGYQFLTKGAYHQSIGTLLKQTTKKRLSKAALESLSIIAYKQPVIKSEIEKIRGVSCDYAIQKLLEKELVTIIGRSDSAGRPLLYGTSERFMDYFGLSSINDLPKPKDFKMPDEEVGEPAPIEESVELQPNRHRADARIVSEDSEYREIENLAIILGDALAAIDEESDSPERMLAQNGQAGNAANEIIDVKSQLVGEVVVSRENLSREELEALIVEDTTPKPGSLAFTILETSDLAASLAETIEGEVENATEEIPGTTVVENTEEENLAEATTISETSDLAEVNETAEVAGEHAPEEMPGVTNVENAKEENLAEAIEYTSEMPISKETEEEVDENGFEETTSENDLAQSMSNEARLEEE